MNTEQLHLKLRQRLKTKIAESKLDPAIDERQHLLHDLQTHQIELEMQNLELQNAQQLLLVAHKHYQDLYDFAPVGYISLSRKGVITQANLYFKKMLKVTQAEIVGHKLSDYIHADSQDDYYLTLAAILKTKKSHTVELRLNAVTSGDQKKSCHLWVRVETKPILNEQEEVTEINVSLSDITAQRESQQQLLHQAFYDKLTELPNRELFLDRFNKYLSELGRSEKHGALFYIDLDNFKLINDSLGHTYGDQLLQHVGQVLSENIRAVDSAARYGGDEFLVLLTNLNEDKTIANIEAAAISSHIRRALFEAFQLAGYELKTESSIGIVLFSHTDHSVDDIITHADIAMYRAKSKGKNTVEFYDDAMQDISKKRLRLYQDIREALKRNEFHLAYQPQVDIDGNIVGAECLLRWQHPVYGAISPADFIPVLEDTILMLEVGEWVITEACQQLKLWSDSGTAFTRLSLAVNVSARQFNDPNFVDKVISILAKTGASSDRLVLEITESMLLVNVDKTIKKMDLLKSLGITFAIDDFGTGYSSLSYIKRLPLDTLKIDQVFVRDVHLDVDNAMLIGIMMAMAKHLKLKVVAEGVENTEELAVLVDNGCKYFQGFFHSRPLCLVDFEKFAIAK